MSSNHNTQDIHEGPRTTATIGLLLLLLCSSFFVLYKSNSAFTSDEVWSVKVASLDYRSEMAALKADVHPPLYFLILHSWIRVFGTGERTVRGLSGLFYVLSGFALYLLGRQLYGQKTALLCAALYLTSPLAILSAQFARMYSLLSLLSILSTWLYLQFSIKARNSRLLFALYIAVNILGTFTHIAFFFLLLGQIVFHLMFYCRTKILRFGVATVLSVVPYLFLWFPIVLGQINNSGEGLAWVKKPGIYNVGELLLLYGGAFWLIVPLILYLWWRSGFEPLRLFSRMGIRDLPLWLLAITILTPLLISQVKPIFNPRLAIIGLPAFALVIGALIGKRANYFLCVELILLTAIGLFFLHPGPSPCDNRSVATYLMQTANDDDVVIFTSLTRLPIDYYLQDGRRLVETSFPSEIDKHPGYEGRINDPGRKPALEVEARQLVNRIAEMHSRGQGQRIFVFKGRHPAIDSILEESLRERFELVSGRGMQCGEESPYFNDVTIYR